MIGELVTRRFYPVQGLEHFRKTKKDVRVIPPRPREGAELGFVFQKDDLTVIVWTTWLLASQKARDVDCGWVLIEQKGSGIYFVPVKRTKSFIANLLMEAKIARCRVRNRPMCASCHAPMIIVRGSGLGSRYWKCPQGHSRKEWDTEEFLAELSEDAKQHLARRRRSRKRWQDKLHEVGEPIRQAMLRRKTWQRVKLPPTGF